MRTYWDNNGQPLADGRLRFVTDLEDGTDPQFTYGKTPEEIFEKLALTNAHAQLTIAQRTAPPSQPRQPAAPPSPQKKPLSADEVARHTLDLGNPAKAPDAVAALFEEATGIDPRQIVIRNFAALCEEWAGEHPEFYDHPGNQHILCQTAGRKVAGKLSKVTKVMLTETFQELHRQGLLFEQPAANPQPVTPTVPPGQNPAASTERPRGTRFATSTRSTNFRAPQQAAQTRTLKYTEEQIRRMPEAEMRRLLESNDPDYAAACDFYFSQATA